jgi:hypothetical protein
MPVLLQDHTGNTTSTETAAEESMRPETVHWSATEIGPGMKKWWNNNRWAVYVEERSKTYTVALEGSQLKVLLYPAQLLHSMTTEIK